VNIIVVSNRLAKAVTLGPREIALLVLSALIGVATLSFALGSWLAPNQQAGGWALLPGNQARQAQIDALARQLGELQAKLIRMDGLVERVGKESGIDIAPYLSSEAAPRGGLAVSSSPLTYASLLRELAATESRLNGLHDRLALATTAINQEIGGKLSFANPLPDAQRSSEYGWRLDPFSGRQVFHEGLDLIAPMGSPIRAAADGKVIYAAYHFQYGNMLDLDHGNGLMTRYAHAQSLNVKAGDVVKAGQLIALLGNSGRSSGPHLHFELRYKGVPQNPLRFLANRPAVVNTARNDTR